MIDNDGFFKSNFNYDWKWNESIREQQMSTKYSKKLEQIAGINNEYNSILKKLNDVDYLLEYFEDKSRLDLRLSVHKTKGGKSSTWMSAEIMLNEDWLTQDEINEVIQKTVEPIKRKRESLVKEKDRLEVEMEKLLK